MIHPVSVHLCLTGAGIYAQTRGMTTPDIPALRAAVASRKGQWAAIARAGPFDYSWVVRFARGDIAEPKLSKLTRLHKTLDELDEQGGAQ